MAEKNVLTSTQKLVKIHNKYELDIKSKNKMILICLLSCVFFVRVCVREREDFVYKLVKTLKNMSVLKSVVKNFPRPRQVLVVYFNQCLGAAHSKSRLK